MVANIPANDADGSIWWEISHSSLATGGWVNASYLAPFSDEPDAHGDCVIYYGEEGCVVAFYAAGELVHVEDYPAEGGAELHYECVYNADDAACDILAFVGPGDGVGNWLGQTPTEFLVTDCANLTGAFQKLACAELALR